jgi:hypothetical protein
MVDSGASSNVMPWSVCQKINAEVPTIHLEDHPKIQGMDTFFGNFLAETSANTNPEKQSEIVTYM